MLYPTAFFTNNHVSLHIYKNKLPMKILYYIYQICIALPILLVLTILTAIVTIVKNYTGRPLISLCRIIRDPSIFFLFMDSSEEISSG